MKILKPILIVTAAIFAIVLIIRLFSEEKPSKIPVTETTETANLDSSVNLHQSFIENIKATEKNCKDAIITEANILYVTIPDDGTNRKGLAAYYCQKLKDNNITDVKKVKLVAFGTQNSPKKHNPYGILLGGCSCK